jgi:hypothetical protein
MNEFLSMSITNRLKEKGFTFDLLIRYDGNGNYYHSVAPRISQVLDWLRTEKNIDIVIYPIDASTVFMGGEKYILSIYNRGKRDYKILNNNKINYHVKWEDAAVTGIEYVLENLI